MVDFDTVKETNLTLCAIQPITAVFVGATGGIGSYTLLELAKIHGTSGKGLRLYLIGRNKSKAQEVLKNAKSICPNGECIFVQSGDLSLLSCVDAAVQEIKAQESKLPGGGRIDILVMAQSFFAFLERNETEEGLDTFGSLIYYSRMKFVVGLLPLLLKSTRDGGASVVSVFGADNGSFFADDLSLREPNHYSFLTQGTHATYLTSFFFETLAQEYPGKLALVHHFPGLVKSTEGFSDPRLPTWFKIIWPIIKPIVSFLPSSLSDSEVGQRVLFCAGARYPARAWQGDGEVAVATDGERGGGAYRLNYNGEVISCDSERFLKVRSAGMKEKAWAHTMGAFEAIEKGGVLVE